MPDNSPAAFRALVKSLIEDAEVRPILRRPARHPGRAAWIVRKAIPVTTFLLRTLKRYELPEMIELWGLPRQKQVLGLSDWLGSGSRSIPFMGDLSPSVLAAWIVVMRDAQLVGIDVPWIGVGDRWIFGAVRERLDRIALAQPDGDRILWPYLRELPDVDIRSVLGPMSIDLLNSGRKLELEGPMNLSDPTVQAELIDRAGLIAPSQRTP